MRTIQHTELNTSDPKAARSFYESLFDWRFEDMPTPNGTYTLIHTKRGAGIGGMQQHPMPGAPSAWLSYVSVRDAARSAEKAESLGATVLQPATDVGIGVFAIFCDPTGATIAVWQQKEAPGSEVAQKEKVAKKAAKKDKAAGKATKKAARKATQKAARKEKAAGKATEKAARKATKKAAKEEKAAKKAAKKR